MSECAVLGCKSKHNPLNPAISFHGVTSNKKYLPRWERVVEIRADSADAKICSQHFKDKDFVVRRGRRILKPNAIPSFNITVEDDSSSNDDDNKNLSILKKLLTNDKGASNNTAGVKKTTHSDSDDEPCLPQNFQAAMQYLNSAQSSARNAKQTSNMLIQTNIKSDNEIKLKAKIKCLQQKLRRRDVKISYMTTALNMIKKHIKEADTTDMKYKLCFELQSITEEIESNLDDKTELPDPLNEGGSSDDTSDMKYRSLNSTEKVESNLDDETNCTKTLHKAGSSGEEDAGKFVEVVHSANLKACF